jgi:hypothetical protein
MKKTSRAERARLVRRLMLDQHGLATRLQLIALGAHRNSIRRALETGR